MSRPISELRKIYWAVLSRRTTRRILAVLAVCLVVLAGCGTPIRSEREVYGHYELQSDYATITLDLGPDHRYWESLTLSNGVRQKTAGGWQWRGDRACFQGLVTPKVFMKSDFQKHDGDNDRLAARGDLEQHAKICLPAGKRHGKTILELNPGVNSKAGPANFIRQMDQ